MKKTYLSDLQIVELVKEGNSIVSKSDFSKLRAIGKKYAIDLSGNRQENAQLFWNVIKDQREALQPSEKFRHYHEVMLRDWNTRFMTPTIMIEYMKYKEIYESEYLFLLDEKWNALHTFSTYRLGSFGICTDNLTKKFIQSGGDYHSTINSYCVKECDPLALKQSKALKQSIDDIFKGLTPPQKLNIAHLIQNHAQNDLTADQFHNLMFAGQ